MENNLCIASDEFLVSSAKNGDTAAVTELVCRYLSLIRRKADSYTSSVDDRDDLIQEGLIGLLKAVDLYDSEKGASFKTYCYICVQSKMLSYLEKRFNNKHQAMYNYLPLDEFNACFANSQNDDPFSIIAAQEGSELLMAKTKTLLSSLEQEVLSLYLGGLSYEEIASQLALTGKAVDNALQRVRRKLRRI